MKLYLFLKFNLISSSSRTSHCKIIQLHLFLRLIYMAPLVDNMWHHICVSLENVQGLWDVLVDGAVMAHGGAWSQTLSVRPGKLVVGQSQGVYGGGFTVGESFKGKVASLNIWSTKMANRVIKEKAKSCIHDLGNVVDWRTFRHGFHGNAEILSPQTCTSRGKREFHTAVTEKSACVVQ